jgi:hypothetical protein
MIPRQEETKGESLVPPRPNLGPEPWPEPDRWPGAVWWGPGLALLVVYWIGRRRRKAKPVISGEIQAEPVESDGSPRQRLIAASEVVRSALIGAFGPAWGSKTTEEIGADRTLLEFIEPDEVARLLGFLKGADRAKFASGEPDWPDDWEAWVASFVEGLGAGASSRSIGK